MNEPELFGIDVDAEVRKVATGALCGPWQAPAELVRRAVGAGARHVEVSHARDGFAVEDDAAPLPRAALGALADVLERGDDVGRHRAVLALEEIGAAELLVLAGAGAAAVEVRSAGSVLRWRRGRPAEVRATSEPGTRVGVRGIAIDRSRARRWTAGACAFAPARVRVDGELLEPRFEAVASAPLAVLAGFVAVLRGSHPGRLLILDRGVLTTEVPLGAPALGGVVEASALVARPSTAEGLRAAVAAHVPAVREAGVRLALERASAGPPDPDTLHALRRVLLWATAHGPLAADAERAPVLPVLLDAGRAEARWSVERARQAAAAGGLWVLGPEQDADAFVLPDGPVLRLAGDERATVADRLRARFFLPQERPRDPPRTLRRMGDMLRRLPTWIVRPRALPEDGLGPAERRFRASAEQHLSDEAGRPARVAFCGGGGGPRRAGRRLWLPRAHPLVRRAVAAVAADPASLYPALLGLGQGLRPSPACRRAWLSAGPQA